MKKSLVLSLALSAAVPACPAESPEALKASSAACFRKLSDYKPQLKAGKAEPVRARLVNLREGYASRYVRVSGEATLSGSGFIPQGSRWVFLTLSGSTDIRDSSGRITSGYTALSYSGSFFVSNAWVSDWVRPSLYVSLYRDGRYLGSARVEGTIHVSGWVSNGWVRLSGSGPLSGDLWVEDAD